MRELFSLPGQDPANAAILESGIFPSLPKNQQKLWLDGENVVFQDRGAEKARGISGLGSAGTSISGLAQAYVDGKLRAYFATASTFHKYEDGDTTELASDLNGGVWSIIPWGNWVLATNGVDKVKVSKDTNTLVDLAGVPVDKARIIRKLAQRPIIFAGQTAYWPRATDIEYWTVPDPTGNAGSYFIRDLDSDVIAVEPLADRLAYYTENKMGLVTFLGGNAVFGFLNKLEGIGAIGLNAVVPVGAKHYGLARDGVWVNDGSSMAYLDAPAANRYIDENLDKTRGDDVVGVHVKDKTRVDWFFRDNLGAIRGIGYNYVRGGWYKLTMPVTAAVPQEVFDNPLAAAGTEWGLYDETNDIGAVTMPSLLTSGGFDAGAPDHFKWWDAVELRLEGQCEVRFGLHYTEKMGDTNALPFSGGEWTDEWLPWTAADRINYIMRESPYLSMQLRTTGSNATWRLGGLTVRGEMAGWVQ